MKKISLELGEEINMIVPENFNFTCYVYVDNNPMQPGRRGNAMDYRNVTKTRFVATADEILKGKYPENSFLAQGKYSFVENNVSEYKLKDFKCRYV